MFPESRTSHVARVMSAARPDLSPEVIDNGGHSPEAEFGRGRRWGFTADLSKDGNRVTVQVYDATVSPAQDQSRSFTYSDGDDADCERVVHAMAAFIGH